MSAVRYIAEGVALDVFERWDVVGGYIDPGTKQTMVEKQSAGWFVKLAVGASFYLGMDKPDIARGDRVRITIEKITLPPSVAARAAPLAGPCAAPATEAVE